MASDLNGLITHKQAVTAKLSDLVRYICFGLIAVYYSISTSDNTFSTSISENFAGALFVVAITAAVAITLDYLQYLFGTINTNNAIKDAKKDSSDIGFPEDFFRFARDFCFWFKQLLAFVGAITLVFIIARSYCA